MFSLKALKVARYAGLLAAAMCIPTVARDLVVPTVYKYIQGAYSNAVDGDRILIVSDITIKGFSVSKQITILGDYETSGIYRKISLSTGDPLVIDADNIVIRDLTIAGYNTSGTCLKINAGKKALNLLAVTIQGPGSYGVRDLGGQNGYYWNFNVFNTTYGIYGDNIVNLWPMYLYLYNSSKAIRSFRTSGSTVHNMGINFFGSTLYAGPTNNANCLHVRNYDAASGHDALYYFEVGAFEAFGYNSRCILKEGNYNRIEGVYDLVYCPYD
jgi:hypothetical protein